MHWAPRNEDCESKAPIDCVRTDTGSSADGPVNQEVTSVSDKTDTGTRDGGLPAWEGWIPVTTHPTIS